MSIGSISNGENGASIRAKLNSVISAVNAPGKTFVADLTATVNNVTGNSTTYTIVWNNVVTSATWASLNTSTGQVTLDEGIYAVDFSAVTSGGSAAASAEAVILLDAATVKFSGRSMTNEAVVYFDAGTVLAITAASGVVTTTIKITGEASDIADLLAFTAQTQLRIVKIS
ncbi:hypothetical protein [Actibacterium sp. MT2.3-13A]|uniref:hypothetical protein n=1 Tax=Actibacterium sp. MT2.3-13A TaxID=2828332 RepID=UPI001BA7EBD3|nr:hypothetical protein [Actibacterium sp. MT2.3-13A]